MEVQQSRIRKFFNSTVSTLSFIGTIWIAILMVIIVADVVGRGIFNSPILGVPEIVKNSIVGLTFLQLTHVLREGRHIRSTVIYDRVSQKGKKILDFITSIVGMVIFALIFYGTIEPAIQAYQLGTFEGNAVRIPTFPTYFLILLGSFFMTLQFIVSIFDLLKKNQALQSLGKED